MGTPMFNIDDLVGEFDEQRLIVHLTAKKPVHVTTLEQGYELSRAVKEILDRYLSDRRGYLITDYSKIIIEPEKIDEYSGEIRKIMDAYLQPGGLARYGFEITRVTARLSHAAYLGGSPNLFNSKEEAYRFIDQLREEHIRAGIVEQVETNEPPTPTPSSASPANSPGR
jgi:hypothetical protein